MRGDPMVTAIIIPILCIYFFWITKKEMKKQKEKWMQLENIVEEAIVVGVIKEIHEERQRFYYHYYVLVTDLVVQTEHKSLRVSRMIPLYKNVQPFFHYQMGDKVRLYGNWKEDIFRFTRLEKVVDDA